MNIEERALRERDPSRAAGPWSHASRADANRALAASRSAVRADLDTPGRRLLARGDSAQGDSAQGGWASHSTRGHWALTLVLGALPLVQASCGEDAAPLASLPLVDHPFDQTLDQPGRLVPDANGGFGDSALDGWSKAEEARPVARTNQPVARLRLPSVDARDREVGLTLSTVEGDTEVRLSLNGLSLGAPVRVGASPTELTLPAPAELWTQGDNVLSLQVASAPGTPWASLLVTEVRYGEERSVDISPGRIRLAPGTGFIQRLESPQAFALHLAGTSEASGILELSLGRYDTRLGTVDTSAFVPQRRQVDQGPFDLRIPLQASSVKDLRVLQLELRWLGEASVELSRVNLEEEQPRPRPPVFFFSIDTLAARHMSLFGYERATTPELERFAEDAVVFEHCLANAPWTLPSYLSVLSGLYPGAHTTRVDDDGSGRVSDFDHWQLADNRWTLAEALHGRGYETAGIVDTVWLSPKTRIDQGFDLYHLGPAYVPFDDPQRGMPLILAELAGWLERRDPSRPPFVFAHALDCHGPYWPEAPWRDRFAGVLEGGTPTLVPARGSHRTYRSIPTWMAMTSVQRLDQADELAERLALEPLVARYDETIAQMDASLASAFALLRERGLYDDALVIVSADHGESFDHQHYDHGEMWEDVLHVPLFLKLPGGAHGGKRIPATVQLVDLYPTILDLLELDAEGRGLHGRSLLPLLDGTESEPRVAFSNGGFVRQAMVARDGWKLIEREPALDSGDGALLTHPLVEDAWLAEHAPELLDRALSDELFAELRARPGYAAAVAELRTLLVGPYYELYDLTSDPQERTDLAAREPERVAELKALLRAEQGRQREARERARVVPRQSFSQEELQRLADIGYAEGSDGGGSDAAPQTQDR